MGRSTPSPLAPWRPAGFGLRAFLLPDAEKQGYVSVLRQSQPEGQMKLDRNIHADGRGKYALINLRQGGKGMPGREVTDCGPGEEHEYFVIMLKDRHAQAALDAYADSIGKTDPEFAAEVRDLADRSGERSLFCQDPD